MAGPAKSVAKTASKNNPTSRKAQRKMSFNGADVVPVLYDGTAIGFGRYMAISLSSNGDLVMDSKSGMPCHWALAETASE